VATELGVRLYALRIISITFFCSEIMGQTLRTIEYGESCSMALKREEAMGSKIAQQTVFGFERPKVDAEVFGQSARAIFYRPGNSACTANYYFSLITIQEAADVFYVAYLTFTVLYGKPALDFTPWEKHPDPRFVAKDSRISGLVETTTRIELHSPALQLHPGTRSSCGQLFGSRQRSPSPSSLKGREIKGERWNSVCEYVGGTGHKASAQDWIFHKRRLHCAALHSGHRDQ